jgi:hypothetical protein
MELKNCTRQTPASGRGDPAIAVAPAEDRDSAFAEGGVEPFQVIFRVGQEGEVDHMGRLARRSCAI